MRNLHAWLASVEDHNDNVEGDVVVQDGNKPTQDPDASGRAADDFDVNVADPAVARVPAASDDVSDGKDKHHDTVDVHVSAEDGGTDVEEGGQHRQESGEGDDNTSGGGDGGPAQTGESGDNTSAEGGESNSTSDDEFEGGGDEGPDHDKTGAAEADKAKESGERTTAEVEPTGDGEPSTGADTSDSHTGGNAQGTKTNNVSSEEYDRDGPQDNVPATDPEPQKEEDHEEALDLDDQTSSAEVTARAVGEVTNDIEEMAQQHEAMESFYQHLETSLENGGLTRGESDLVRLGLEQIHPGFGGEAVVASTESFGLTASRVDSTQVSLEGIKENIQKVIEAIKRAVKWMMDLMKDLYHKATGGMSRNRKRLEKLKSRLGQVQTNQVNDKVTIRGSQKLVINGEFAGNDLQAVDNVQQTVGYLFKTYPKDAVKLMSEMEDLQKNVEKRYDPDQLARVLPSLAERAFSKVPGSRDMAGSNVGGVVSKVNSVSMSTLLPGNKAVVKYSPSAMKEVKGNDATKLFEGMRNSVRVRFVEVTTARSSNQSEVSYNLPSKQSLVTMYEKLDTLAKTAEDHFGDAQSTFKDIEKTLKMDAVNNPSQDQMALLNYIKRLPGDLTAPLSDFMGYLSSVVNAYVSVLEHNIRQYETAEKKQSGQNTNALPAPS